MEEIFSRDEELNSAKSYFAGASGIPGILKCLAGSIHELRMEGFSPKDLDPFCFIVPEKGEALKRLLSGYKKFLSENRLVDQAGLITSACRVLKEGKAKTSPKIVLILSGLSLSGGIPITYTRPGKGLILYLQWQSEDFPEKHLRQLFAGGYLDIGSIEDKEKRPSPGRIASILREAGIGWGRNRYEPRINALKAGYLSPDSKRP